MFCSEIYGLAISVRKLFSGILLLASFSVPSTALAEIFLTNSEGMVFEIATYSTTYWGYSPAAQGFLGGGWFGSYGPGGTRTYLPQTGTYYSTTQISTPSSTTLFYSLPVSSTSFKDVYDRGYVIFVDGQDINWAHITTEADGREIVFGPHWLTNVNLTLKVFVPDDQVWVRYLVLLENPAITPIEVTLQAASDFGSGTDHRILATQGGDRIAGPGDRWFVSTQVNKCCDPHLFHNMDGPGGVDALDEWYKGNLNTPALYWRNISIPGESTVAYAFFVGGRLTGADALATAMALAGIVWATSGSPAGSAIRRWNRALR